MSDLFEPHMEILPPPQRRLWQELAPAADLGFVLYGGTAIALRLGHRQSIDFDFFSDRPLNREGIQEALPFLAASTVLQDEREASTFLAPSGDDRYPAVKLSFFGNIVFGRVGNPSMTADGVVQAASLDDLMATKVKVVLQRAEAKDYRDVAAMLRAGVSLAGGLAAARELFGANFQPSESLKALTYFDDGDLRSLPKEDREVLADAVHEVRDLPKVQRQATALDDPALRKRAAIAAAPAVLQVYLEAVEKTREGGDALALEIAEATLGVARGYYDAGKLRVHGAYHHEILKAGSDLVRARRLTASTDRDERSLAEKPTDKPSLGSRHGKGREGPDFEL